MDVKDIFQSWVNYLNPTPPQFTLSKKRLDICEKCDMNVYSKTFGTFMCKGCGCPIKAKIFSLKNSCPNKYWEE